MRVYARYRCHGFPWRQDIGVKVFLGVEGGSRRGPENELPLSEVIAANVWRAELLPPKSALQKLLPPKSAFVGT
jgi:hypothetical protein